jgi:hypothetical protein
VETATTPLAPFTDGSGNTWNSLQVQQTETFNYAYPETQSWAFQSTSDYQNSILNTIQTLYGTASNQFTNTSSDGADNFIATSVPLPAVQVSILMSCQHVSALCNSGHVTINLLQIVMIVLSSTLSPSNRKRSLGFTLKLTLGKGRERSPRHCSSPNHSRFSRLSSRSNSSRPEIEIPPHSKFLSQDGI